MDRRIHWDKELKPFDDEIKRLETIRLFLGLELERHEKLVLETKKARIKRIKDLEQNELIL